MRKLTSVGSQKRAGHASRFRAIKLCGKTLQTLAIAAALSVVSLSSASSLIADDGAPPQVSLEAAMASEFLVALPLQDAADTETDEVDSALDDALKTLGKERADDEASNKDVSDKDDSDDLDALMDSDSEDADSANGIDKAMVTSARVPKSAGGRFILPELRAPTIATDSIGTGRIPRGFRQDAMAIQIPLPESGDQRGIPWQWQVKHWAAANTFHHPLYFEDRMLERHGHERFGCMQPVASGIRFFGTTAILPYMMTVSRPWDCEYSLGYFRSGDCVPTYLQRPPCERKAAIVQGLTFGAAVWVLP